MVVMNTTKAIDYELTVDKNGNKHMYALVEHLSMEYIIRISS